ncbi:MAG: FAD-dependent oxidoreductase [Chlamydiota bacterium]
MIARSHFVENWPAEVGISGSELAGRMRQQARKNGAKILEAKAISVDFSSYPYQVRAEDLASGSSFSLRAPNIVIAMGTSPNLLGVPGESTYFGKGVSTCAVCDGSLFAGKKVAVVGGGDSAILDAEYLANLAKEVHIFVRKPHFKTTENARKKSVLARKNVFVHHQAELAEIRGDGASITSIEVVEKGEMISYPMRAVFLAIGARSNTEILGSEVRLTSTGYILLERGQQTSQPHVFAIGDITDPVYKQAISAAADGAKAAIEIQQQLLALSLEEISVELDSKKKSAKLDCG